MSTPPTGQDGGTPVDRRWFEEALRSQGFVVEPPTEDFEPEHADSEPDLPSVTVEPDAPAATPSVERPPMPSALLARIAARGQQLPAAEAVATPAEPEAVVAPELVAEPGSVIEPERPAPWASAVVASVAPWTSSAEPAVLPAVVDEPEPEAEPEAVASIEVDEPDLPLDVEPADELTAVAGDATMSEEEQVVEVEPEPLAASSETVAAPTAALDSPYEPAPAAAVVVAASAPVAQPPAAPAAAPEASEGELWALVGASEPAATTAPTSETARVILTILTAFLILVIVVGGLVLASQIA